MRYGKMALSKSLPLLQACRASSRRQHFLVPLSAVLQPRACQSSVVKRQSSSPETNLETDSGHASDNSLVADDGAAVFAGDKYLRRTERRSSSWQAASLWQNPDEWTTEPEYPPIIPPKGTHQYTQHHRLEMAKRIAALPTVREKRHAIVQSLPFLLSQTHLRDGGSNPHGNREVMFRPSNKKSRAWDVKHLEAWVVPCHSSNYNALPFVQHLTKTDIFERDSTFSDYYAGNDELVSRIMNVVTPQLESTILTSMPETFALREHFDPSPGITRPESYAWRNDAKRMIDSIFRLIQAAACREKLGYLQKAQFHKDALIEAYTWRSAVHGFDEEQMALEQRATSWCDKIDVRKHQPPWKEALELVPAETCFQLRSDAYRVLRHSTPLPPVVARSFTKQGSQVTTASDAAVAVSDKGGSETTYNCFPPAAGYEIEIGTYSDKEQPLMSWLDGSWMGNCNPFVSMLFNPYDTVYEDLIHDDLRNGDDIYELMCADIVGTCFAQCTAQAYHQGFTFLNELHNPITMQYVLTDGQEWVFGLYQCNTHAVWQRDGFYGPYRNFAWISPPMRLFDRAESASSESVVLKNINTKVLEQLVRMFIKEPQQMSTEQRANLQPFVQDSSYKWTTTPEEVAAEQDKDPASVHHIVSEAFAEKTATKSASDAVRLPDSKDVQKVVGYVYRTPAGVKKKQRRYRHNGYLGHKYSYYHK